MSSTVKSGKLEPEDLVVMTAKSSADGAISSISQSAGIEVEGFTHVRVDFFVSSNLTVDLDFIVRSPDNGSASGAWWAQLANDTGAAIAMSGLGGGADVYRSLVFYVGGAERFDVRVTSLTDASGSGDTFQYQIRRHNPVGV